MRKKDIPNMLSIIRILLVPVFVLLYIRGNRFYAIGVFITAGLTDVVDGYIARKYNYISNLGKLLDPLADKLLQLSAFLCLYWSSLIPVWMPVVYFAKELFTAIGAALVFGKEKKVVKSHVFGKLATVLVFAAVCIIAVFGENMSRNTVNIICVCVCLYFVFSCVMYAFTEAKGMLFVKESEKHETQVNFLKK